MICANFWKNYELKTMAETTFYNLVENLENYLEYQRDEGVQRVEVDRAVLAELAKAPVAPAEVAPVVSCGHCLLCHTRANTVPGAGKVDQPEIMFVAEELGADEDAQGHPFAGEAGCLLVKMIEAMGYRREEVFIANVVKRCPAGDQLPSTEEMAASFSHLQQQITEIKPKVMVGMGATVIKGLLGKTAGITRLRGTWQECQGVKLMPTFHPSYLLRDPSKKKVVWQDLQLVLKELDREPPPRNK